VIRDGENGLLFDLDDPEGYARTLVKALKDPGLRESLVREGHRTAKEHSWVRIAARIEEIYLEILEG
jgi:glycosyltransferase involved in cell wall biosynthesis